MPGKDAKLSSSGNRARLNTKWINNALRSIGSITKTTFNDISPNLVSAYDQTSEIMRSVKDFSRGKFTNNVSSALNGNKYVKTANTAYRNALKDIKSGNFDNTDRLLSAMSSDEDSAYSVGTEDEGDTNLTVNIPDQSSALASLSSQMQKNTEAQIKMTKASMDAQVAISTASMMQMEKVGSEINLHLTNIENSMAALVQFNMNNMQKYIDMSAAYYERVGASIEAEFGEKESKVSATDVFSNRNGGINLSKYKQYVIQQFKDTPIGTSLGMLTDEQTLKMLAANPLGTVGSVIAANLMPKVIKNTMEAVEEVFSATTINVLDKVSHLSERVGDTFVDQIIRGFGDVFGLRSERTKNINGSSIVKKGATPFDGITKHAITEVITKELREQTQYLKIIANHYDSNAASMAERSGRVFDYNSGRYVSVDDVNRNLAESVSNAIRDAFRSGSFGRGIGNVYTKAMESDISDKDINRIMDEFYSKLERSRDRISVNEFRNASSAKTGATGSLNAILKSLGGGSETDKKVIQLLVQTLQDMANDRVALDDFYRARFSANSARNEAIRNIQKDPYGSNYFASTIFNQYDENGEMVDIDKILDQYYKRKSVGDYEKYVPIGNEPAAKTTYKFSDFIEKDSRGKSRLASNAKNNMIDAMRSFVKLDYNGVFDKIGSMFADGAHDAFEAMQRNFFHPLGRMMFGDKNTETGYFENGIFASTANMFKDLGKSASSAFTGNEWTDSKGKVHKVEHPEDTVLGSFRKVRDNFTASISKIFTGESDEGKEPLSIPQIVSSTLKKGFEGWSEALFGKSYDDIRSNKDQIIKDFSDKMPKTMLGGAIGAGVGGLGAGSLLGWFVGGPIGGALMGMATGFAANSEKFQEWFFGKSHLDENGNKVIDQRGLIPESLQKQLKDNKTGMITGGTIGAGLGALTGGGFLGTLVGGPLAGAIMGVAGSFLTKSKMWQEFLYGDEKSGQRGLFETIGGAFTKFSKNSEKYSSDNAKVLGMGIIGAGGGALTAGIIAKMGILGASVTPLGPIGGAIIGLGASMLAQKDTFHEWLFGKKNDKGEKVKEGVLGRFANGIKANVINPLANVVADVADEARLAFKYEILDSIRYAAEPLTEFLFGDPNDPNKNGVLGTLIAKVDTMVSETRDKIVNGVGRLISFAFKPIGTLVSGTVKLASKAVIATATAPFKLIHTATSFLTSKIVQGTTKLLGTITGTVKKTILDPLANVGKSILKFAVGGIGSLVQGAAGVAQYGVNQARGKSRLLSAVLPEEVDFTGDINSFSDRWKARREQRKLDEQKAKQDSATRKQRTANEKFIYKWTNGQYVTDTEEARQAAIANYNAKNRFGKRIESEDDIRSHFGIEALDQKKNATSSGIGIGSIAAISDKELPWEGKTYKTVSDIYELMQKHFDPDYKKDDDSSTSADTKNDSGDKTDTDTTPTNKSKLETFLGEILSENVTMRKNPSEIAADIAGAGGLWKYGLSRAKSAGKYLGNKLSGFAKFLHIPGYASGTSHAAQIALTGENGPEIAVTAGGNTAIAPHGGGMPVFITGMSDFVAGLFGGRRRRSRGSSNTGVPSAANSDNVMDDGKLGNTADELQNRKEDEEKDQATIAAMTNIAENTEETKVATIEQNSEWSSIFGKKGIFTVGAIALFLLITNWIKKNGDLAGVLGKALGSVSGGIMSMFDQAGFKAENNTRTNGESVADTVETQADRTIGSAGQLLKGDVLGAAGNFVTGSDGEWDHQSNANLKFIAKQGANLGYKGYKVASKVYQTGEAIGKTVAKGASKVASLADNVASKVTTAATTLSTDVALGNISSSSLIGKAIGLLDDGLKTVVNAVNKTLGSKVSTSVFSKAITKLKDVLSKGGTKVASKLSAIFGKNTAATVAKVVPLINIAFIGISALNGLTGAARLFRVNKDDVDLKMRAISAAFAGISATLPGTIIDVLNELLVELTGVDLLHTLAVIVYNFLSSEEDKEKLSSAQTAFEEEYLEYQEGEIQKSYQKAIADGTIDSSVTYDSYKSGVESGKYQATYKSFEDYNNSENQSVGGKIVGAIGSGVSKVGGFVYDNVKKQVSGVASIGKDLLGMGSDLLSGDMDSVMATAKGFLDKALATPKNIAATFNESVEAVRSGKAPTIALNKGTDGNPLWWIESTANFFASVIGTGVGFFYKIGDMIAEPLNTVKEKVGGFFGGIVDFFTGGKDKEEDSKGGRGGRGGSTLNGFSYYSQNDPRWSGRRYSQSGGKDPNATIGNSGCGPAAMGMVATQMTGRNVDPVSMARFAQKTGNRDNTGTNWRFIDDSSKALGLSSTRAMNPSAQYISNQLGAGHPMILSGRSVGGRGGAFTKDGHYVVAVGKDRNGHVIINDPRGRRYSGAYNLNDVASETGAAWSFGGRGEGDGYPIENGAYYYAQKDSRWANDTLVGFPDTNPTVGSSGCVMTSAAMGVSSILGTPIDPGVFNAKYGNGNVGSTSFTSLGINAQRITSSNGVVTQDHANSILSALQQGKPVMLFGQKEKGNVYYDGGSTGKGKQHCVLATGLDSNGNIIINDPVQSAQNTKKTQSFTIDQLYPNVWTQTLSSVDGDGIQSNLRSTGMQNSYYTAANYTPNTAFNNVSLINTDLKQLPKLGLNDINNILLANWAIKDGSIFTTSNSANSAKGILQAQNDTGVSAIVPLSIGALESGWGTSKIAKEKGNLWGWQAYNSDPYGSAASFGDNQYGAFKEYTNNLLNTYYDGYGAHTLYQIGTGENPAGKGYAYHDNGSINKSWPDTVNSCGTRMIKSINGTVMPTTTGSTSGTTTVVGSTAPDESTEEPTNILGTIGNFITEFASRAVSGVLTGKFDSDYSSVFNPESSTDTTSGEVTEDSGGKSAGVRKVHYPAFGGRGYEPPKTSVRTNTGNLSTTYGDYYDFFSDGGRGYGTTSNKIDSLVEDTLKPIVPLLREISENTSVVADKISDIGNTTNVNETNTYNGGNVNVNGKEVKSSTPTNKKSLSGDRNGYLARKIAHAG